MTASNESLLRAISQDRALGSAMLFGHRHEQKSPDFHVAMMDLWRCQDEFVLIETFRGGAKTTLSEEFLAMEGLFGNFAYCIIFGETYTKACQKIEAIDYECRTNHKLGKIFGGKTLAKKSVENKIWFAGGAVLEGAGWEQEITGFKHHDRRPDRAYFDDIENLERVRSTAAVDATLKKLYSEVMPALDKTRRKLRITQTPRAVDCLVTRLRSNPDWLCAQFPICSGDVDDPLTVSAWPSRYPMEWVQAERDRYERAGELRQFQQEYLLSVDTAEAKPFVEDMLRSIEIAPAAWLPRYGIFDPARTANVATSARTGKVVVSRLGSKIIVHESGGYFWKPDEIRADVFATWRRHHCAEIGIEKDSLDEFLLQPIRFEMMRQGVVLPLRALNAPQDRDKSAYIMGLHPFFAAGDILLVGGRGNHPQLVAEILNFPGGKVDILNALAHSLKMFAGQPVYEDFGEANIGPAPTPVRGEVVTTAWHANASEVVCAVLLRSGRHLHVARDWAQSGPVTDCVRMILAELKATYPSARFEATVPAELHDAWQRIALVPALKAERLTPWRGEHIALARGCLAERLRMEVRHLRLLTVDKGAPLTMNALASGYKYPIGNGGRQQHEPEPSLSRLIAEALECTVAVLDRQLDSEAQSSGNYGHNAQGVRYRTALPNPRRT